MSSLQPQPWVLDLCLASVPPPIAWLTSPSASSRTAKESNRSSLTCSRCLTQPTLSTASTSPRPRLTRSPPRARRGTPPSRSADPGPGQDRFSKGKGAVQGHPCGHLGDLQRRRRHPFRRVKEEPAGCRRVPRAVHGAKEPQELLHQARAKRPRRRRRRVQVLRQQERAGT